MAFWLLVAIFICSQEFSPTNGIFGNETTTQPSDDRWFVLNACHLTETTGSIPRKDRMALSWGDPEECPVACLDSFDCRVAMVQNVGTNAYICFYSKNSIELEDGATKAWIKECPLGFPTTVAVKAGACDHAPLISVTSILACIVLTIFM